MRALGYASASDPSSNRQFMRGYTWDSVPPQDGKALHGTTRTNLNVDRIKRLALAALPKLVKRFSLDTHYVIDNTTGAWRHERPAHRSVARPTK